MEHNKEELNKINEHNRSLVSLKEENAIMSLAKRLGGVDGVRELQEVLLPAIRPDKELGGQVDEFGGLEITNMSFEHVGMNFVAYKIAGQRIRSLLARIEAQYRPKTEKTSTRKI